MYESFFHFQRRPFASAPDSTNYFPGQAIEHARQSLVRSVDRAQGPGLLIGPAGTGKSLLCQLVADHFRDSFSVALLANTQLCTRKALLQSILFELNLPYRDLEEGELRLSLIDHLEPGVGGRNGLLLILDEAHTLPLRLLEEVRMITNIVRHGQPRVRLLLAGGPQLEERFASPKLETFNQRIAARCYLQSLSREETFQYIRTQIKAVGGVPEKVFDESALRAVFQATDGVPRLINQVCDYALLLASVGGRDRVDASSIEEAWGDLQQIPAPWQTTSHPAATQNSGVVEFGELDSLESSATAVNEVGNVDAAEAPATISFGQLVDDEESIPQPAPERSPAKLIAHAPHNEVVLSDADSVSIAMSSMDSIEQNMAEVYANEYVACELDDLAASPAPLPLTTSVPIVELRIPATSTSSKTTQSQAVEPRPSPTAATTPRASTPSQDPFGDDFDDEEVVIDNFAAVEDGVLGECLKVASVEGRVLAAAFRAKEDTRGSVPHEPTAVAASSTILAPTFATETPLSLPVIPTDLAVAEAEIEPHFDPANDPVLPEVETSPSALASTVDDCGGPHFAANASFSESYVALASPAGFAWDSLSETTGETPTIEEPIEEPVAIDVIDEPAAPAPRMRVVPPDDRDLLVFDEEAAGMRTKQNTAPSDGRARRQEYRHLFAKLRRG